MFKVGNSGSNLHHLPLTGKRHFHIVKSYYNESTLSILNLHEVLPKCSLQRDFNVLFYLNKLAYN